MFDFRSDTVTMPDAAMRQAMAEAQVGDDVYREDETVTALEKRVAGLLGKEAGLFVSSGTQSNLIAMLCHASRGEEVISGDHYHTLHYEAGGVAALGGVIPCPLTVTEQGSLHPEDVIAAIKPDDPHFPISRLLCLENTHNGLVQSVEQLTSLCQIAAGHGLSAHLDGARLMNAVMATNQNADAFAAPFDTISLCLSKGLGAPVGSVLVGREAFIEKARRYRKMLGGGMRQAGVLAAAGLYALEHNIERLSDDHQRAKTLAQNLSEIDGVQIEMQKVQTNMVYMAFDESVPDRVKTDLPQMLRAHEVTISPAKQAFRLVVHKDISDEAVGRLSDGVKQAIH